MFLKIKDKRLKIKVKGGCAAFRVYFDCSCAWDE
jgi:hypothetical protein